MIKTQDRSGYFGASDTSKVIAQNRNTRTWQNWWFEKCGKPTESFHSRATFLGNAFEHSILRAISEKIEWDRQIIIDTPKQLLRVNYDGDIGGVIYEVKTHRGDKKFEVTNAYLNQAQVEMYAWQYANEHQILDSEGRKLDEFKKLYIVAYGLDVEEYNAQYDSEQDMYEGKLKVDKSRIKYIPIKYDRHFIKGVYLPSLKELTKRLRKETK